MPAARYQVPEYSSRVRRSQMPSSAFVPFTQMRAPARRSSGREVVAGGEFQEPPLPSPEPTPIPGVGQHGVTGTLPVGPGPADPYPPVGPATPADYWTRIDPNMGQPPASITIHGGGGPEWPPRGGGQGTGVYFNQAGQVFGGFNGPQGSVYGLNPNTGNLIYNADAVPANLMAGGQSGRGSGRGNSGGNYPAPSGPRSTSRTFGQRLFNNRLINPFGRRPQTWQQNARSRPTQRWQDNAASNISPRINYTRGSPVGGSGGFQQMHPGEYNQATFGGLTPTGFRDPAGSATFDSHAANLQLMANQSRGGNPNNIQPFASEGRFLMDEEGTPRQYGRQYGNPRSQVRMSNQTARQMYEELLRSMGR